MKDDGGAAFPIHIPYSPESMTVMGMSLRDYFAASALNRLLAWDFAGDVERLPHYAEQAAKTAYAIADFMLAQRSKQ